MQESEEDHYSSPRQNPLQKKAERKRKPHPYVFRLHGSSIGCVATPMTPQVYQTTKKGLSEMAETNYPNPLITVIGPAEKHSQRNQYGNKAKLREPHTEPKLMYLALWIRTGKENNQNMMSPGIQINPNM